MKICPTCGHLYEDTLPACDRCGWHEEEITCHCGAAHMPGSLYCSVCGKKIAWEQTEFCSCGTVNPPNARFCRQCGKKIAQEEFCVCGYMNPFDAVYCRNCGKKIKKVPCAVCGRMVNEGGVCASCGCRSFRTSVYDALPPVPKNPVGLIIGLWVGVFCLLSAVCFFI